jgi:hypothetical protein
MFRATATPPTRTDSEAIRSGEVMRLEIPHLYHDLQAQCQNGSDAAIVRLVNGFTAWPTSSKYDT